MPEIRGLFEDAVDIPAWLDADQATPFAERSRRDRAIAKSLAVTDPEKLVREWWSRVAPAGSRGPGAGLARMRRWIMLCVLLLGVLGGLSVSATVLRYDGSEPVNVVLVLVVLVGVQWLLLLPALLAVIPGANRSRVLAAIVAPLNPAAVIAGIWRRLLSNRIALQPGDDESDEGRRAILSRSGLSAVIAAERVPVEFTWRAGAAAGSRLARWQIVVWSQCGAMAFNVAAVSMALLLLAFTDLAFAWSTTFDIGPVTVFRLTTALSVPWQSWLPEAVPSADLVESSRWFRLDQSAAGSSSAEVLTGWWPFLLLTLLVYGLLPRVLFGLFAAWRLRVAIRALLLEDAGVMALIDRMQAERVDAPASIPGRGELAPVAATTPRTAPVRGGVAALVWSEAIQPDLAARRARDCLGVDIAGPPAAAGGGMSLADDQAAADALIRQRPVLVVVFVRAWEPPLLELLDFLNGLRERLPAAQFLVHPIPESGVLADPGEVTTWRRSIGALGDKGIHVDAGQVRPEPGHDA